MCLFINSLIHPDKKPKVADRPLVVKKRLRKMDSGKYLTPYQGGMVEFEKKIDVFSYRFDNEIAGLMNRWDTIEYGHHSFLYYTTVNDFMHTRITLIGRDVVWVYGVIPAGTRFYVGIDNDIVSESIVYYKTLDDLKEAYGCKKLGKSVHINQL